MTVIVRQPRSLPIFAYQKMAEGARFETTEVPETIGLISPYRFYLNYTKARGR